MDENDTQVRHSRNIERYTHSCVAKFSEANRGLVQMAVQARINKGLKPASVYNFANGLLRLDRALKGKGFLVASPVDYANALSVMRAPPRPLSQSSVFQIARHARTLLADARDGELPRDVDRALKVRRPPVVECKRVISDVEFRRLLEATNTQAKEGTIPWAELSQAILWTLWDSGFRAQELLSLNVGDVRFENNEGAYLAMRSEMPGLKRGARTIYVVECVGPLRAWLGLHSAGTDPKAPLFPAFQDRTGRTRMFYKVLARHVKLMGDKSGVNQDTSRSKTLSPHDFRHTAMTRDAIAGRNEAYIRTKYGLSKDSKEPARYVHYGLAQQRAQVRRDAGIDGAGYTEKVEAADPKEALWRLLQQAAQGAAPTARTRKPADHEMP